MAKLQNPVKQSFDSMKKNLVEMHKGIGGFSKALDKVRQFRAKTPDVSSPSLLQKFKDKPLPTTSYDALANKQGLIDRAIGMHFLREGQFEVASAFLEEANADEPLPSTVPPPPPSTDPTPHDAAHDAAMADAGHALDTIDLATLDASAPDPQIPTESLRAEYLREQFQAMYHILDEMQHRRNLGPAMAWARDNSAALEARGSNLEFELHGLRFMWLLVHGPRDPSSLGSSDLTASPPPPLAERQHAALAYARTEFPAFQARYAREIRQLATALAYAPNLPTSPYRHCAAAPASSRPGSGSGSGSGGGAAAATAAAVDGGGAWAELATAFAREFCSRLGLAAAAPLGVAATAGAVALPTLLKLRAIMAAKRTEWTTAHELPVEIPLPPSFRFHSIFVCPVSKEQTTDANPPMLLPCGHVIAKESLHRLSKVSRFKCPYCPGESHPKDARRVFL